MFDTGSTSDALSPEFARVAQLKIHTLEELMPIQLGCKGSRSKINYSTDSHVQYASIDATHYFDVVNIDRFDAIIGIGFMRRFRIVLDPPQDTVLICGISAPTLSEGEESTELAHPQSL